MFERKNPADEIEKIEKAIIEQDLYHAQSDLPHIKEQLKEISEGVEKIKVVPVYGVGPWVGTERSIGDPFETSAYVIRQEVDGEPRLYVGRDKLGAKKKEFYRHDANKLNQADSDHFEIDNDGKITVYALDATTWNPPVTWRAKNEIIKTDDKIMSLKNKITGGDTESRLTKDLSSDGRRKRYKEIDEMEYQRNKK